VILLRATQRDATQMLFNGFKGYEGQKAKLFAVPNWQERLTEFVDELIK